MIKNTWINSIELFLMKNYLNDFRNLIKKEIILIIKKKIKKN